MGKDYNINFSKVLNNFFNKKQLEVLQYFKTRTVDIDELKKYGDIEEIVTEKDGITIRTINYTSYDGLHSYSRTYTYNQTYKYAERVRLLNAAIDMAIVKEDYERAAKLKRDKVKLLEETDI